MADKETFTNPGDPEVEPTELVDPRNPPPEYDYTTEVKENYEKTPENPFGLGARQRMFLSEYLVDFNIRRAARVCNVDYGVAYKWSREDRFVRAVDAYLEKRRRDNEQLVVSTLNELMAVMTSDVRDYLTWDSKNKLSIKASADLKNTKAIKGIEKGKGRLKLILHDKVKGIELMMLGLGMMKKAKGEELPNGDGDGNQGELGTSLMEALQRAHSERAKIPLANDGVLMIGRDKGAEDGDADTDEKAK